MGQQSACLLSMGLIRMEILWNGITEVWINKLTSGSVLSVIVLTQNKDLKSW